MVKLLRNVAFAIIVYACCSCENQTAQQVSAREALERYYEVVNSNSIEAEAKYWLNLSAYLGSELAIVRYSQVFDKDMFDRELSRQRLGRLLTRNNIVAGDAHNNIARLDVLDGRLSSAYEHLLSSAYMGDYFGQASLIRFCIEQDLYRCLYVWGPIKLINLPPGALYRKELEELLLRSKEYLSDIDVALLDELRRTLLALGVGHEIFVGNNATYRKYSKKIMVDEIAFRAYLSLLNEAILYK